MLLFALMLIIPMEIMGGQQKKQYKKPASKQYKPPKPKLKQQSKPKESAIPPKNTKTDSNSIKPKTGQEVKNDVQPPKKKGWSNVKHANEKKTVTPGKMKATTKKEAKQAVQRQTHKLKKQNAQANKKYKGNRDAAATDAKKSIANKRYTSSTPPAQRPHGIPDEYNYGRFPDGSYGYGSMSGAIFVPVPVTRVVVSDGYLRDNGYGNYGVYNTRSSSPLDSLISLVVLLIILFVIGGIGFAAWSNRKNRN